MASLTPFLFSSFYSSMKLGPSPKSLLPLSFLSYFLSRSRIMCPSPSPGQGPGLSFQKKRKLIKSKSPAHIYFSYSFSLPFSLPSPHAATTSAPHHVSALVRDSLVRRARDFNIVLDDVAFTHLSDGAEFSIAVEKKQVAQQEAERSKFLVAKAEQEEAGCCDPGRGRERGGQDVISDATAAVGTGILVLRRRIEAAREIEATLAQSPNLAYLPGGNNMLLGINPTTLWR